MKQVYAAGTLTPMSLNGHPLPTMFATSAGVSAEQMQAALGAANYTQSPTPAPVAVSVSDELIEGETPPPPPAPRVPPIRLALLKTVSAGRVLSHTVPAGERYFSHTLLNVPPTADAQLAIQTWGSPAWQRHEREQVSELPELPYLPVADVLDDTTLREWLSSPAQKDLLEFALRAVLGTPNTMRIILAAPADDVAKVVYALTRVLPPALTEEFTFSTFEAEPLLCMARLVGHESPAGLGDVFFQTPNVTYHATRKTTIANEVPYAAFAVDAIAAGAFEKLDEVKAHWQRLGLTDAKQFDLVFRLTRGTGVLEKDEAAAALKFPALAAWVASRTDAMKQFQEWALEDRTFATESFSRAVQSLRQKHDATAKLAQAVREAGLEAIRNGDTTRTANALEVIMPMVAPSKANAIWGEVLTQVADPSKLSWPMRGYLLPRLVRSKQQQQPGVATIDPAFQSWFDLPPDRLGELFSLDLPRGYIVAAARACLNRTGEPTPELTKTLAAQPKLVLTLLQPEAPTTRETSQTLFQSLLKEAASEPWFEQVVAHANDYPKPLLNSFFEATLEAGMVDADRVIRTQGATLLGLFSGQSGLDRLGKLFLLAPPSDLLHNRAVLDFLNQLHATDNLSQELSVRISAVKALRGYLDSPTFTPEELLSPVAAMQLMPPVVPASTKLELFEAVAKAIRGKADSPTLQADLERAVETFGPVLANDSTDLFENLLREIRAKCDFGRETNLVVAFLAVSLGATISTTLNGKLDGLDGQAFAIANAAAARGGNRVLDTVDARTREWPKEARTKWGFLLAAVRPDGIKRIVRDVACVAIGAAVASIGWWIAR